VLILKEIELKIVVTENRPIGKRRGGDSFSAWDLIFRSEGGAAESDALAGDDSGAYFRSRDCLFPFSGAGCKQGEFDGEWLPRDCPRCGQAGNNRNLFLQGVGFLYTISVGFLNGGSDASTEDIAGKD